MDIVKSALIWIAGAVLTILLYVVIVFLLIFTFPFDKKRKISHAQCYWWANAIISMNPNWELKVNGLENIDRNKAYVIVANHQSLGDIIVIYKIHTQFKWIAKESLFKIPFLGWNMSLIKHIKLMRGEFGSIKKVYKKAARWLRKGMSILFFPEGTRTKTGEMSVFQNGAFKLAIKEKKPILPIRIEGTRDAIPHGTWIFKTKVKGTLTVFPAIETKSLRPGDFKALKNRIKPMLEPGH